MRRVFIKLEMRKDLTWIIMELQNVQFPKRDFVDRKKSVKILQVLRKTYRIENGAYSAS